MRTFEDLDSAIREIRRDLSKAPEFTSTRVQGDAIDLKVREQTNYAFTILEGGMPSSWVELMAVAEHHFPFYANLSEQERDDLMIWANTEANQRLSDHFRDRRITETLHPMLQHVAMEGNHPSYTYAERTRGMVSTMVATLAATPDSRRAFWPIFQPVDSFRAPAMTRIPCTLGYQAIIREVVGPHGDPEQQVHLTNLMRSCDFGIYWVSDLWFSYRLQAAIWSDLHETGLFSNLMVGNLSQFILSFHTFDRGEEIY